jgi:hypothetical protein
VRRETRIARVAAFAIGLLGYARATRAIKVVYAMVVDGARHPAGRGISAAQVTWTWPKRAALITSAKAVT